MKHRKVFELEKLYNKDASCISCEVVGGASAALSKCEADIMEYQSNQLAPRIQMPAKPFKAKAEEYISKYIRETNTKHNCDVMEMVIEYLSIAFGVSKQATKIRMVELGFENAIGTFTYLDGHYLKPHDFRKGSLKVNQTLSVSAQDVAIQRFFNQKLRKLTENGDYLFVNNHYVYNAPLYVCYDENGHLVLADMRERTWTNAVLFSI